MQKRKKFYTLSDIKKQLIFTPLIFVFIVASLSIVVVVSVLEVKKNNEIKLFLQKDNFNKKTMLNQYIEDVKNSASSFIDEEETNLNRAIDSLNGYIKYSKSDINLNELKKIIQTLEKDNNLEFVIFDKTTYKILYGAKILKYLKKITNSEIRDEIFQRYMLKSIIYIGDNNLMYWTDKPKTQIRSSFFKDIKEKNWYLGAFTKNNNMKDSIKKSILNTIVQKSKYYSDSYFWFYDYDAGYVYNYYNKGKVKIVGSILNDDRLNSSNKVLKNYNIDFSFDGSSENYSFSKYNFLISIKSFALPSKISKLEYEYNSKLSISITIIILVALFLIIASILFYKFINMIFYRYNKRLETKNIMYKKWKDRYELAIIASNDGLWDINLKTNTIYFSKKWLEMFGYEYGDLNTLDEWLNLIHKDDMQTVKSKIEEHIEGKSEHFICEYRIRTKNEGYKWVLVRGKAFKGSNQKLKRMLMMSMDINQGKKLTKELKYVDLLVEYGRIVIFKWKNDKKFTVEYLSQSISSYGYNREDFTNNKIKYVDFVHEDDLEELKSEIDEAIKNDDKSFTKIYRVKDKDGTIKWVFNRTIFLKDDFGNVTHLYGYINDITQMKLNEEELKAKIAFEVKQNTEKDRILVHQSKLAAMGEMLGSISHQWRQPLNNINLLTHFIRDSYGNLTKEQLDEIIEDTKLQINYMSQTIDDFRNFYQPNKDKIRFEIKEAIILCSKIVDTQFEKANISLKIAGDEVEIVNYKNEFQQVILNILNNAEDVANLKKQDVENFKPKVKINVKKQEKTVLITLQNNCGEAPAEVLERMFEPYFTTKFENKGTGIGLYMAKTIIEKNMMGTIEAENIQEGIIFKINLPL